VFAAVSKTMSHLRQSRATVTRDKGSRVKVANVTGRVARCVIARRTVARLVFGIERCSILDYATLTKNRAALYSENESRDCATRYAATCDTPCHTSTLTRDLLSRVKVARLCRRCDIGLTSKNICTPRCRRSRKRRLKICRRLS